MNELFPVEVDEQLESIAKDIELLQATATLRIAERLAEAHKLFLYKRDEGGFQGWVETRLKFSRRTAYSLLDVHKQFGDSESVQLLHTLPRRVLYFISRESTPESARAAVLEAAEFGERITVADVEAAVKKAREEERAAAREAAEAQRAACNREKLNRAAPFSFPTSAGAPIRRARRRPRDAARPCA
jgi:hypothetical protein